MTSSAIFNDEFFKAGWKVKTFLIAFSLVPIMMFIILEMIDTLVRFSENNIKVAWLRVPFVGVVFSVTITFWWMVLVVASQATIKFIGG